MARTRPPPMAEPGIEEQVRGRFRINGVSAYLHRNQLLQRRNEPAETYLAER